ncbi:hypothetical protein [Roseateles sp. P5_E7]
MKRGGVAGFDPLDWAVRHRFFVGSVALHVFLASGLWLLGPQVAVQAQRAQEAARSEATLRKAQREQIQRHLKRLEQLGKQAGAELPDSAASSPLERAEALTNRLEETERKARIKELARLLKISLEEAAAQVRLEDWKRAKPAPRDAAQALAQLEGRARDAIQRRHAREQREREGVRVAGPAGAGGAAGGGNSGRGVGGEGPPGWQRGGTNYRRDYDAAAETAQIDPAKVRFAAGRRFGPGGPYANRIYLDRWNVIGPFPAPNRRDLMDIVQPPEIAVDLDAVYAGKHGLVGWRPQQSPTYPFVPDPWEEYAIYYAATEVRVDRDMDVWLDIGADDDTKLWLNDELVWVGGNGIKPWYQQHYSGLPGMATAALVEGRVRVHLQAGRNTLLLKLYNAPMETFFSIIIAS